MIKITHFDGSKATQAESDLTFVENALNILQSHSSKMVTKLLVDMNWSDKGKIAPCLSIYQVFEKALLSSALDGHEIFEEMVDDLDYVLTELGYTIEWSDYSFTIIK